MNSTKLSLLAPLLKPRLGTGLSRQRVSQLVRSLSLPGLPSGRHWSAKRLHQPTAIALSLPAVDYYTLFKERARQTIPPWVHNATL